jgi:hypothetical protein
MWPATIVQQLSRELPPEFTAEPRTHLGSYFEIDVCAYEEDYAELLELIGQTDPAFGPAPPPTYAATCRGRKVGQRPRLEIWAYPLAVGSPLPTLPIWLRDDMAVSLDLETSYEETCRALRIR